MADGEESETDVGFAVVGVGQLIVEMLGLVVIALFELGVAGVGDGGEVVGIEGDRFDCAFTGFAEAVQGKVDAGELSVGRGGSLCLRLQLDRLLKGFFGQLEVADVACLAALPCVGSREAVVAGPVVGVTGYLGLIEADDLVGLIGFGRVRCSG